MYLRHRRGFSGRSSTPSVHAHLLCLSGPCMNRSGQQPVGTCKPGALCSAMTMNVHLTMRRDSVWVWAGEDLHSVLWLKSRSSEVWLDRRTTYTRSTAVLSMVGYLLGLGDRHPSNLMLDRYSGKLLHIDFGDCFEASMHRA